MGLNGLQVVGPGFSMTGLRIKLEEPEVDYFYNRCAGNADYYGAQKRAEPAERHQNFTRGQITPSHRSSKTNRTRKAFKTEEDEDVKPAPGLRSTPEDHRKSKVQSVICNEWGKRCRDVECINQALTEAFEAIEELEKECDMQAIALIKAKKTIQRLKQGLKEKDEHIADLKDQVRQRQNYSHASKAAIAHQDTLFYTSSSGPTTSVHKKPFRHPLRQVECPPEALAALAKLSLDTVDKSPSTGSIISSGRAKGTHPIREVSTSKIKQKSVSETLDTQSDNASTVYASALSTPATIVRDCESTCSLEHDPGVTPHFVGSPNWEPVFKLKECMNKVGPTVTGSAKLS